KETERDAAKADLQRQRDRKAREAGNTTPRKVPDSNQTTRHSEDGVSYTTSPNSRATGRKYAEMFCYEGKLENNGFQNSFAFHQSVLKGFGNDPRMAAVSMGENADPLGGYG